MGFDCAECGHQHTGPAGICIGCACPRTAPDVRDGFMGKLPQHGVTCRKVEHPPDADGFLHAADDDGWYDVDGLTYCGRCHEYLPRVQGD
jgi:hypothetical protein